MDIGTLLLMLAIATLTIAFILQPLFARRSPQRDELIAHWVEEIGWEHTQPEADIVCPQCGRAVRAGDRFCPSCGTRLKED
jgi:DNA-directed RNA polymerase subunit RPC12/RpoP